MKLSASRAARMVSLCQPLVLAALIALAAPVKAQTLLRVEVQAPHSDSIDYASKSQDGKYLVTSGQDYRTKIWDIRSGKVILTASGQLDCIWRTGNGNDNPAKRNYNFSALRNEQFLSNNLLIVSEWRDGSVRIIDVASSRVVQTLSTDSIVHYLKEKLNEEAYYVRSKAFFTKGNNGDLIVVERLYGTRRNKRFAMVELWSRSSNKLLTFFRGAEPVVDAAGKWLAFSTNEGVEIHQINTTTALQKTVKWESGEYGAPYPLSITDSELTYYNPGRYIPPEIHVDDPKKYEPSVHIENWRLNTHRVLTEKEFRTLHDSRLNLDLAGKWRRNADNNLQKFVQAIFLPQGNQIMVASENTTSVLDLTTGALKRFYRNPPDTMKMDYWKPVLTPDTVTFIRLQDFVDARSMITSDGAFALLARGASSSEASTPRIIDLIDNNPVVSTYGESEKNSYYTTLDSIYAFKFSPDRNWIVQVEEDFQRTLGQHKAQDSSVLTKVYFHNRCVLALDGVYETAFSKDSKWLRCTNTATGKSAFLELTETAGAVTLVPFQKPGKKTSMYSDSIAMRFFEEVQKVIENNDELQNTSALHYGDLKQWTRFIKDSSTLFIASNWLSGSWYLQTPHEFAAFPKALLKFRSGYLGTGTSILSGNGTYYLQIEEAAKDEFIHLTLPPDYPNPATPMALRLCDSGGVCKTLSLTPAEFNSQNAFFSKDGSLLGSFTGKHVLILATDSISHRREILLDDDILYAELSPGNSVLLITTASRILLWDIATMKEVLSLQMTAAGECITLLPSGLFDASQTAMRNIHFIQNGTDVIELNQLKERYYEPGLWKKRLNGEALRKVEGFKGIDLPPDIRVGQVDGRGYLPVELINRGGGIGEVTLYINGKEAIKDIRKENSNSDVPALTVNVYVATHKSIVKGQQNMLAVKAWNREHWVESRGEVITYTTGAIETYVPAIHILSCGVSDYTGEELDLKYAAKDAEDISKALKVGAEKLFGIPRSFVYTLTTGQPEANLPTKKNILATLEKISVNAHPLDVFVMYISGHGINYGGASGDWYYLTQEAYTGRSEAFIDPGIRESTTISSNELVEWFTKVPALKQALVIDACASGRVLKNLVEARDISSTTLRALDRMRDRAGLYVITGCTADAVSYEASKYGQGVLTYSLLEGIRGASLRENQFVDIGTLFGYAQERVPTLASGIGGIQKPQVFSPQEAQSFDIGFLTEELKKQIPLASIHPVYIRSNFQDDNELMDVLQLGKQVDDELNSASSKGINAPLIFVDVLEYPDACQLVGRYEQTKGAIKLKLRKKCGSVDQNFSITARNVQELRQKIIDLLK